MTQQQPTVIHEFELGRRGFVRTTLSTLGGKQFVDVRLWVEPRDAPAGGQLIATRKGLSVPVAYVDELIESVQALAAHVARDTPAT